VLRQTFLRVAVSGQPVANLNYCVGESLRRLLRQIVSRIDDAVFMRPNQV
jgi:hypothetical protein